MPMYQNHHMETALKTIKHIKTIKTLLSLKMSQVSWLRAHRKLCPLSPQETLRHFFFIVHLDQQDTPFSHFVFTFRSHVVRPVSFLMTLDKARGLLCLGIVQVCKRVQVVDGGLSPRPRSKRSEFAHSEDSTRKEGTESNSTLPSMHVSACPSLCGWKLNVLRG